MARKLTSQQREEYAAQLRNQQPDIDRVFTFDYDTDTPTDTPSRGFWQDVADAARYEYGISGS